MTYLGIEPLPEDKADVRVGLLRSTMIHTNPFRSKGSPTIPLDKLLPRWGEGTKEQTVEEQLLLGQQWAAQGGRED